MILPPFLKPGDRVALVSTSNFTELHFIQEAVKILESWRLKPVLGKSVGPRHGSFAGSDALRQKDLQQMPEDAKIKAIRLKTA